MLDSSVKKLSASVSDFDIILASPSVTIPAIAAKSIGLQANLRLVVESKLEKVKDIQFRFVGGVVISLTTENEYFYNSERLFDQTIIVSDLDDLEPKTYEFPISLSLPTTCSPSILTPNVRIQYLCVAVVGFENGCCGWVPILQQEPVRVKREIRVNNEGLLPGFKSRCVSEDTDLMSLIGNSLIWSPNDDFLLELGPSQTTVAPWHLMCQVSIDYVIERVDYKIVENSAFRFTYLELISKERNTGATIDKNITEQKVLQQGCIEAIDPGIIINSERRLTLKIDPNLRDAMPDIYTKCCQITHDLELECHIYKGDQLAGQSSLKIIKTILPFQLQRIQDEIELNLPLLSPKDLVSPSKTESELRKRK